MKEKSLEKPDEKDVTQPKEKAKYVSNKGLLEELHIWKDTGVITEKIGKMFLEIATRYTSKPNFNGYSFRDDMISDSVARMISQINKYKFDHPTQNPFAYFTQICHNQVLGVIKQESKFQQCKVLAQDKYWNETIGDNHGLIFGTGSDSGSND